MNISRAMKYNIQLSLKLNRKKRLGPTLTPTRTETLKRLFKTKHNILKSILSKVVKDSIIQNLKLNFNELKSKMELVSNSYVDDLHKNMNCCRYSEDWLLLCMLLYIRSTCTYKFLLDQHILPLPCPKTIRTYLSLEKS
ncbi:Uncharacterized protein FWK35_00020188 [Aphis craccivora]|uniref:Uncharacterized protein n=1 Tax=Aphis craccivora TaxID=307492 RepID=A0A6G0W280_APHCR|nr:Uncharacterized protein FWK35_00020188 [Aphis craccivora]